MEYIKKHKILLIICLSLILLTLGLLWLFNRNRHLSDFEYQDESYFLRNYEINEVIPVSISDEFVAKLYLSEYITLLVNEPEKAYELLEPTYKEKFYPTYESFAKYIKTLNSAYFYAATLKKYEIRISKGNKEYNLIDLANNNFIFLESGIMDYQVLLHNYQ